MNTNSYSRNFSYTYSLWLKILKEERLFGLNKLSTYQNFSKKVKNIQKKIFSLLNNISKKNNIVAYGASDRGMVLMNYCKIGSKQIDFVVDKNPFKHNFFYSICTYEWQMYLLLVI